MTLATRVSLEQITLLAPRALPLYREAFAQANPTLDCYAINTPLRIALFMAQVLHESNALTVLCENLRYSPSRLQAVWPSRFKPKGALNPLDYAFNPERLAEVVYGNRMGNSQYGDGFKYRGRGLLQLTGKDNYAEATKTLRKTRPDCPDFVVEPDLVVSVTWCLEVAAAKWQSCGCNQLSDQGSLRGITQKINGGEIGLKERQEWFRRTSSVWKT